MRLAQSKQATLVSIAMRHPAMKWGPPGGGKSSGEAQVLEENGYAILDWRLPELESIDMRGLPRELDGRAHWLPPIELPVTRPDGKVEFMLRGKKVVAQFGVVLLDELPQAKMDVKNVAARFLLERRIGEWVLPDGWHIICCGNRMGDAAGSSPMPTHLNNRLWHIEVEGSLEDWMENFVEPRESGTKCAKTPTYWVVGGKHVSMTALRPIKNGEIIPIDHRVVAYLQYRPDAFMEFDPTRRTEAAFPTSRSWHMLSDMLYVLNGNEDLMDAVLLAEYCAGFVGKKRGGEFAGFLRTYSSLVSIPQILLDPNGAPISRDSSVCYALATALATHVKRDTIGNAFTYLARLSKEFQFVFGYRVKKVQPTLQNTKAFVTFAAQNADFV